MTRILGVDLGSRRIGLAVSDASGTIASPLLVLERGADRAVDHGAILQVARDHEVGRLVVGWPRSLSGRDGPAALAVREEVAELETAAGPSIAVVLHDERFSTVTAAAHLRDAGAKPRGRGAGRRRRRANASIDAAAAAVFLQSYLDAASSARGER